jgi:hypothetical protein
MFPERPHMGSSPPLAWCCCPTHDGLAALIDREWMVYTSQIHNLGPFIGKVCTAQTM